MPNLVLPGRESEFKTNLNQDQQEDAIITKSRECVFKIGNNITVSRSPNDQTPPALVVDVIFVYIIIIIIVVPLEKNTQFDLVRDLVYDKVPVVVHRGEDPGIHRTPVDGVDALLVLEVRFCQKAFRGA